ncbi:MAG: 3-isopropylmalate dehydratase large subunit, partial [Bacteroidetes bacterium]
MGKTLFDKVWDQHVVMENDDGSTLLYIDRHLIHEVTSPQAFEGLRLAGRKPWRPQAAVATPDHNVPTAERDKGIADPVSRAQVEALDANCREFGITEFGMDDIRQGIVHVVGPEQGLTLPGMTVVCGDSHTSTHGAFACIAMGIGTSEVEHVLATQCLIQKKPKRMRITIEGALPRGVTGKDVALYIIGRIGTAGGTGFAIEYAGKAVRQLSMEGRMSLCNMSIEAGARCGMVAVDDVTLDYVKGRPHAPQGEMWEQAESAWRELVSDADAQFDAEHVFQAADIAPQVSWGTSPEMVVPVTGCVPHLDEARDEVQR